MQKLLDIPQNSAIVVGMKEELAQNTTELLEKCEVVKEKLATALVIPRMITYKPHRIKPRTPKFRLSSTDEFFLEGNLKQGINPTNIVKKFKERLLEKEAQSIKYQQQENERRAKANKKKEEDAAEDK